MPRIDDDAEMNAQPNERDPNVSELAALLEHGLGQRERAPRHASLSLQPTLLPPPPDDLSEGEPGYSVSPDDDLDLGLDDDDSRARRRQLLLAASGVSIAILGAVAWLIFGQPTDRPQQAAVPPIQPPPVALPVEPPATLQAEPPQASLPPSGAPTDAPLGSFSNDLVPPVTDGLSPPRKVNAVRIIVENDREVRPAR